MTSILISPLTSRGPGAVYQPEPRLLGPAQDPEIPGQRSIEFEVPDADGEHVTLFFSPEPTPGNEARNPAAERLIGGSHPVFGPAIVSSGDAWHMSDAAVGHVLRTAGPEVPA